MKKLLALFTACILVLGCLPACAENGQKDLLARIRERGTLIVATEGNWAPWTYHDENDRLTGFDMEIAELIAAGLGVKVDAKETEWSAILAGVDSGRFDIACNGVDYTEVRAEKYAFSDPYIYNEMALVVRKDNEDIHDFKDLSGKVTANSPNSTYEERAKAEGASVIYVEALAETMLLVLQGRADATINAVGSVDEYMGEHPDANLKTVLTVPGLPVCFPMRKTEDAASLVEAVNEILRQAREDGTLKALSLKYFGVDLTQPQ